MLYLLGPGPRVQKKKQQAAEMLQNLQENRERKKEQEKKEKERVEIEKLNLQHRITKIDQKEKQLAELKKEKILQLQEAQRIQIEEKEKAREEKFLTEL